MPAIFCITIRDALIELNDTLKAEGGLVMCQMDDSYACGPQNLVTKALRAFRTRLQATCGLRVDLGAGSKTCMYSPGGVYAHEP